MMTLGYCYSFKGMHVFVLVPISILYTEKNLENKSGQHSMET